MTRGWSVVVACLVGLAFSMGPVYFQTFGLFVKPIAAEFGWGRTQLSAAVSMAAMAAAFVSPAFGRAVDRHGARKVALASTIGFSIALAALFWLPSRYPVYLAMAASLGAVATGCSMISYMSVLPRWFNARLGTAFAFAITGLGIGQFVMPLYANALIQTWGWRLAYAVMGLTILAITVPNALLLLKDRPDRNGEGGGAVRATEGGVSYRDALATPVFWRLACLFLLITVATTACMVHVVPMLTDRGLSATEAAAAAALMGVAALAARFVVGVLLDHVAVGLIGGVTFAGGAAGVLLILSGAPGVPLTLGVLLLGAALGAEGDLMPYVVRRVFGLRDYSAIYGSLFVAFTVGLVIGPLLLGLAFDALGNYAMGLKVAAALAGVSALLWLPGLPGPAWLRHGESSDLPVERA